jgi:hypothetical protein
MSYYSWVRVEILDDDDITTDMLLSEAKVHLSKQRGFAVEDILSDLKTLLTEGSVSFNDLESISLSALFLALSRRYPALTLRIWGHGEDYWDIWSREFKGGKQTFKRGPFEQ